MTPRKTTPKDDPAPEPKKKPRAKKKDATADKAPSLNALSRRRGRR